MKKSNLLRNAPLMVTLFALTAHAQIPSPVADTLPRPIAINAGTPVVCAPYANEATLTRRADAEEGRESTVLPLACTATEGSGEKQFKAHLIGFSKKLPASDKYVVSWEKLHIEMAVGSDVAKEGLTLDLNDGASLSPQQWSEGKMRIQFKRDLLVIGQTGSAAQTQK